MEIQQECRYVRPADFNCDFRVRRTFYDFNITDNLCFRSRSKKRKCTAETTGKVVDKVQGSDNNLYPVIEYEAGGVIYRRKKNVTAHGSINNGYPIGYELIVLYDPEKPKRCLIGGTKVQTVAAFIPAIIGLVFFTVGVVIFLF